MDGVQKTQVWSEVLDPLAKGGRTHKSVWTLEVVSSEPPPTANSTRPSSHSQKQQFWTGLCLCSRRGSVNCIWQGRAGVCCAKLLPGDVYKRQRSVNEVFEKELTDSPTDWVG